ncbi:MAG TPA: hypothetical protein VFY23_10360 [Candidatus Limnocylindrales bacterium]|nr:hypothetical protein [Candidatus Limnocylindrales bacterium]
MTAALPRPVRATGRARAGAHPCADTGLGVGGRLAALALLALVAAGCVSSAGPTPDTDVPATAAPGAAYTLSPEAAAAPRLAVTVNGRTYDLAGYDPAWPEERALDVRYVLRVAPHARLERGETYDLELRYTGLEPVLGWLPPDFGHIGGSEPVRTEDGFVADAPTSAFVRADALPDFEPGLFAVKVQGEDGPRIWAFPLWIDLDDVLDPAAFAGLRVGYADADGSAASRTFIDHIRDDLRRGGAAPAVPYPSAELLREAFDAGELDDAISIPAGWGDKPTTRNGFEALTRDPRTGNGATDTGNSYVLDSLVARALGPAGLIINRGY